MIWLIYLHLNPRLFLGQDFDLKTHRTFRITNFTAVTGRRQLLSPLIPYCQAWFGLAVQDKAAFQYVL